MQRTYPCDHGTSLCGSLQQGSAGERRFIDSLHFHTRQEKEGDAISITVTSTSLSVSLSLESHSDRERWCHMRDTFLSKRKEKKGQRGELTSRTDLEKACICRINTLSIYYYNLLTRDTDFSRFHRFQVSLPSFSPPPLSLSLQETWTHIKIAHLYF